MSHSNSVINLVSRDHETRHFYFQDVLVDGARSIAKAAAESNVGQFIHVSHLLATEDSDSVFMQAKAEGQKAVLEEYPNATIMRPADAYGDEDKYLNRIAY